MVTSAPSCISVAAMSRPQRSAAALSSDGDSSLTNVSKRSRSQVTSLSHQRCRADKSDMSKGSARRGLRHNSRMVRAIRLTGALVLLLLASARVSPAQTPAPFPRPSGGAPAPAPPVARPSPPPQSTAAAAAPADPAPDERLLGVPIFAGAEFIASYDAGRGQRYYLFGTNTSFTEVVAYYRTALKQRGELVYEEPPVHEFDVGRYREETHGVSAGGDGEGLHVGRCEGLLEPEARRAAGALQDDRHDRAGRSRESPGCSFDSYSCLK